MTKIIRKYADLVSFFKEIKNTDFENIPYSISLTKTSKKRSIPQNKLYWLYLACIEENTGNYAKDLHEYFKDKYLQKQLTEVMDRQILVAPTTTKLSTKAFNEYLERIVIFASTELSITLPNPDDLQMDSFIEHYSKYIK